MVNTSKFFKCLIIFLMYNIIITFTVSCTIDYEKLDKDYELVLDYDTIQEKDDNYFSYNLRHPKKVGQQKVDPTTFFKSLYDRDYIILPELKDVIDYDEYNKKINDKMQPFGSVIKKYEENYKKIKDEESELVEKFDKSYKATEDAYKKVIEYENQPSDETKKSKEEAITNYLNNQMSELSSTISNDYCKNDGHKLYMYKNYEIYAEQTNEIYYCSSILKAEYNIVRMYNNDIKYDYVLSKLNYQIVIFLYLSLEMVLNGKIKFSTMKNDLIELLALTFRNKKYKDEIDKMLISNVKDDDDILEKLKSEFLVNSESYTSYLLRMKMLGNVAFYKNYHKDMYKKNQHFSPSLDNTDDEKFDMFIVMDIHTELSEGNYSKEITSDPDNI